MARDILGEFGRDTNKPQAARATNGGQVPVKDVLNYKPPQGPINIGDAKSPGLHGQNYGNAACPNVRGIRSGSPGLGGDNSGVTGTQRKR